MVAVVFIDVVLKAPRKNHTAMGAGSRRGRDSRDVTSRRTSLAAWLFKGKWAFPLHESADRCRAPGAAQDFRRVAQKITEGYLPSGL
jgi:hypothetical protein